MSKLKFSTPFLVLCILLVYCNRCTAQELYIHTEPASNIPKNVIGIRALAQHYQAEGLSKQWYGLRGMYGITARWMVMVTANLSNHNGKTLPSELFQHAGTHYPTAQNYSYKFDGVTCYTKYRLYSSDEMNKHLRVALYGEYGYSRTVHVEAEPNLMGDNSGLGGGLIVTKLIKKLAVSAATGLILPQWYKEKETGHQFKSGNAATYSLSAGYLLHPKTYTNYKQTNINVYIEAIGKHYTDAILKKGNGVIVKNSQSVYKGNSYIDIRPGVQFIFNSNLRLDLSATAFKINQEKGSPVLFFALQYYLLPE